MRLSKLQLYLVLIIAVVITFQSCSKDDEIAMQKDVQFTFTSLPDGEGRIADKGEPGFVAVTLTNESGIEIHKLEKIELLKVGDGYVSKPLALKVGTYQLTEFLVLDEDGEEALYLTPIQGSEGASLVEHPLPISVNVHKDEVTTVSVEVINALESPSFYGYAEFIFNIKHFREFLVASRIQVNNEWVLSTSHLSVRGMDENEDLKWEYEYDLKDADSLILLPEAHEIEFEFSKEGYEMFTQRIDEENRRLEIQAYLEPIDRHNFLNGSFERGLYGWTVWEEHIEDGLELAHGDLYGVWFNPSRGIIEAEVLGDGAISFDVFDIRHDVNTRICRYADDGSPHILIEPTDGERVLGFGENGPIRIGMYQDIELPSDAQLLSFDLAFVNSYFWRDPYQQLTVSVRNVETNEELDELFKTPRDYPLIQESFLHFSLDISQYTGQTVRIEFRASIEADFCDFLVDNFKIE